MREKMTLQKRVMLVPQTGKALLPVLRDVGPVFGQSLTVIPRFSLSLFSTISSSLHQCWIVTWGCGMKGDPRYTPSDVFETFPLPEENDLLDAIGRELDESRGEIMVRRELGLTALYNLVNDQGVLSESDPDVAKMRDIHRRLDEAVMAAYGWDDVPLCHGFHEYRKMVRWTVCPEARSEILDRLLELNHERYAAEPKGDK